MPTERPKKLYFVGALHPVTGEPESWINGIPARDLDEAETASLSDDDFKVIDASGLYQKTEPTGAKAEEREDAAKAAKAQPEKEG